MHWVLIYMSKSKTIAIRISDDLIEIAEKRMNKSGEKSIGKWLKKIVVAELLSENETEKSSQKNPLNEELLYAVKSIENSRELMLRSFQYFFELGEAKNQFEMHIQDVQNEWENITRNHTSKSKQKHFESDNFFSDMTENLHEIFGNENSLLDSENELSVFADNDCFVQSENESVSS